MKVDILYLITDLELGGAERNLYLLCREMKNKFNLAVAVIKPNGALKKNFSALNIEIVEIGALFSGINKYLKILKQFQPAIIQAFLPRACYLSRISRKKEDDYFLINTQWAIKQRLDWGEKFYQLMERLTANRADLIIANSESAASHIRAVSGVERKKVRTIYLGVDISYWKRDNFYGEGVTLFCLKYLGIFSPILNTNRGIKTCL